MFWQRFSDKFWCCLCSPTDHERLVSEGKGGSIVIDYDRSTMILWGSAVNDTESVKMSLAALAAPSVTSRDALPLFSRSGDTAFSLIVSSIFVKEEWEVERIIQSFVQILKFWYNYCVILTEILYGLEGLGYWSKEGQQCCYLHQSHWSKTILLCSRQQCHQTLA